MQLTLTWQSIITAGAVLGAAGVLIGAFVKLIRWIDRQKQQDAELQTIRNTHMADMEDIKQEQTLLVYGILACLKGLQEQGCNGPVTEAIKEIDKHLNEKAHQ